MKIAIDFDDVISSTNKAVCEWHNRVYNTTWTIDDFHYYHYWKNPGWGSQQECFNKVRAFYNDDTGLNATELVDGAKETLSKLKAQGHDLTIVTARSDNQRNMTRKWLDTYLGGMFNQLYFTGQFTADGDIEAEGTDPKGVPTQGDKTHLSKADIIDQIGAELLIDDSIENAFACAGHIRTTGVLAGKPIHTLLFSPMQPNERVPVWHYPWNVELSKLDSEDDQLPYDERRKRGLKTGESRTPTLLPPTIERVTGWEDVLRRIEQMDTHTHPTAASIEGRDELHAQSIGVQA